MSLELINTFATLGTFLVIAATAIAAAIQLRHMRSSNQIVVLGELRAFSATPDFQSAEFFIRGELAVKLQDPAFRRQVEAPALRTDAQAYIAKANAVGNFYEDVGVLVKTGLIGEELITQIWSGSVIQAWEDLAPFTAISRRGSDAFIWENFEYLAVTAQDWRAAHPAGSYPTKVRRMRPKDQWLEADKQYAASIAPA